MNKDFDPSRRNGQEPKIPISYDKFNDWLTLVSRSQSQLLEAISLFGKSGKIVDPDLIQMEEAIHTYPDRVNWATSGRLRWAKYYNHLDYSHRMDMENITESLNGMLAKVEFATIDKPLKLSQQDISEHMEYIKLMPVDCDFRLIQSLNLFLRCKGFMSKVVSESNENGVTFEFTQYSDVSNGKQKYYKYLETPLEDGSSAKLTFSLHIW